MMMTWSYRAQVERDILTGCPLIVATEPIR
jgi:hypothetical protein